MSKNMEKIFEIGLVPLVVLDNAADAVPLAKALVAGGIPVAEVTFRTDAAKDAIAQMAQHVPDLMVGAGTVHTVEKAKEAVEAGAQFIVTPGFIPDVVRYCVENDIDIIPGTVSPADIEQAMSFGLTTCKFFPAEAYGGVKTLKALAGPYADIRFMPTGGVNAENMNEYLSLPNVAAVGGSFMLPGSLVKEKNWAGITALCQETLKKALGFELLHVGINTKDKEESLQVAGKLASLFGLPVTEFPGAYFAGSMFEVIKGKFLGAMGHIAISTCDIDRAVPYFKRMGVAFQEETASYDDNGNLISIYFAEEIGGFALHLRRR